ncbi:hypothetical protein [Corynebacterium doosanense]|uniref:Uncharacterized protein n=1 Tax=Corynebacterium doosanense CAU 212 = DSM 45436 TaxID=558173 RepID=A0A097IEH0_9CORY|nr:hypothetical protein [Corynebacterium doosanense]AIT60504.1 hypothetical protein CDOO_04020 [Corynebacterium doosanense CAU 212 = DSM 45436]
MTNLQHRLWHTIDEAPTPRWAERWRTPERTRALVIAYFFFLALSLLMEIGIFLSFHFMWPLLVAMACAMGSWTMLRNTIGAKDMAPRHARDDYENQVLDQWRSRALTLLNALLIVGAVASILIGTIMGEQIRTAIFATATGIYLLFTYLAVSTLPAVGFALTFNRPTED